MNTKKALAITALIGSLLYGGCSYFQNEPTTSGEIDETKYSGSLFSENIRSTEARTPEEQRLGFRLPEGFEIQLFASEPDIEKPINLSFDARGRMWVTQSFEYPFPASPGKGKDRLTILEDTDGDGRADRFTHFDDTLNIPIGVLPINDGAIVYSIPNVSKFSDTDGDGKVDKSQKLLGPFQYKDTHGMVNNFVRGYDGWVHACHGYTNRSTVTGTDGHTITMVSGNTFRFRPDGSRVEQTTFGRINPFGLVYDEAGYLYSTDCHTSPLYQLIRGGDYSQWGKEPGMGFAPDMKRLEDEATALAGIGYYADVKFPLEYQRNFYIGDAVRSRVYRNSFTFAGSTPVGKKEADFILSEDPWFRPVDVKLGPDGALYIADFYNSIIGHYEVPLDHPKRDKIRGRIWRVTYKGKDNRQKDWTSASVKELLKALKMDNMPTRMLASDQLTDRIGKDAIEPVKALFEKKGTSARERVHALWILQRLGGLTDDLIIRAAADADSILQLHTLRILAERSPDNELFAPIITNALNSEDPHLQRAAVELLMKFPVLNSIKEVLALRQNMPEYDTHLLYTTRLCLRNLLRNSELMKLAIAENWDRQDAIRLADVMIGVPSAEAGGYLLNHLQQYGLEELNAPDIYQHIARYAPDNQLDDMVKSAMQNKGEVSGKDLLIFKGIQNGLTRSGRKETLPLIQWGKELAVAMLTKYPPQVKQTNEVAGWQLFAAELAGKYQIHSLEPALKLFLEEETTPVAENAKRRRSRVSVPLKTAALKSLLQINLPKNAKIATTVLNNEATTLAFKKATINVLGEFPGNIANNILGNVKNAPPDLQENIFIALAGSSAGKDIIFRQVRKGVLLARTLIQPKVEERLLLNITPAQKKEFTELVSHLDPIDEERQALIYTRLMDYEAAAKQKKLSYDSGKIVFMQNCSACHQIGGKGGEIGPNLDGLTQWGPKALAEKILDPNRNISENFRNYTIKLKDGKVTSGLYRRDEGAVIIFADVSGKEFSISKKDIAEQVASRYTLMPDNFRSTLSPGDFNSLIAFLLDHKTK